METTEHGVCISPLSSEVLKADESFFPSPGLFYYFCDGLNHGWGDGLTAHSNSLIN